MPIVLTRPQNEVLLKHCQQQGIKAFDLPLNARRQLPPNVFLLQHLAGYDCIFAINAFTVRCFAEQLQTAGLSLPHSVLLGGPGVATQRAWQKAFPEHEVISPEAGQLQDAEHFFEAWKARDFTNADSLAQNRRILVLRASVGKEKMTQLAEAHQLHVDYYAVYDRMPQSWNDEQVAQLKAYAEAHPKEAWVWLISSSQGVVQLLEQIKAHGLQDLWAAQHAWCIHPRIAQAIEKQAPMILGAVPLPQISLSAPHNSALQAHICQYNENVFTHE